MTKEERAYNYASTQKCTKLQVGEIAKHYNNGYEQAEKDLALIPYDIGIIFKLVLQERVKYADQSQCYKDVLQRFKEWKYGNL